MKKKYELLDEINFPSDLKKLPESKLQKVADELREEMIDAVSVTGGHLGASLGVVELTVALHYIFNTPNDKLIWDVGHQCYPHKILTGRKERIRTLRQEMVFLVLQKDQRVNTIPLVLHTAQHQFHQL